MILQPPKKDPYRDGYGNPLKLNTRGEYVNEIGDTRCPNDGEMTNVRCWSCGWERGASREDSVLVIEPEPEPEPEKDPRYIAGSAEAEVERMVQVLDQHLPAIFASYAFLVEETWGRSGDELTERDVAIRAGYSAVHWIAKEIATGTGEGIYDLPSVLDLMKTLRKERTEEGGVGRVWDEAFSLGYDYGRDERLGMPPRRPQNPYTRKMRGEE